jgi:hypothetical protein
MSYENLKKKMLVASIWICETFRTNHMFHILREVG